MTQVCTPAQQANGKIKLALARLAGRYPFHAKVLEQFQIRARPDLETMAVTVIGKELLLLYRPEFVLEISADQLVGVLLHETHHVVFGHVLEDPNEFPDHWARTVAEEVTVNEFIREPLPGEPITLKQFPKLPPLESTTDRYQRLQKVKRRFPISPPELASGQSGESGESSQVSSDSSRTGAGRRVSGDSGNSGDSSETSSHVAQAAVGKQAGGDGSQDATSGPMQPNGSRHTVDDHRPWQEAILDRQAAQEAVRDALLQAMLAVGTEGLPDALRDALQWLGVGIVPSDQQVHLLGDRQGQLDWRHLLRRYVGQVLEPQPVLHRPPRRFPELAGIVPARSRRPLKPQVMAVIDTSGSITDELLERIDGELRRLSRDYQVTIVECDMVIHNVYPYRALKSVAGRGGTDFRPPLEPGFLSRHHADLVVYFTDGDGPAPDNAPKVPVIWCLVPRGVPPATWGRVVHMDG